MAKWKVGNGINKYVSSLQTLQIKTSEMCGRSIWEGAKIIADEIKRGIAAIPVGNPRHGYVTVAQKTGLYEGLGIAPMQNDNGYLNVKIGMDGYNSMKSPRYPKGQPNAIVARSIESGSSFSGGAKRPFIGPAVNRKRKESEMAMAKTLDEEVAKAVNG